MKNKTVQVGLKSSGSLPEVPGNRGIFIVRDEKKVVSSAPPARRLSLPGRRLNLSGLFSGRAIQIPDEVLKAKADKFLQTDTWLAKAGCNKQFSAYIDKKHLAQLARGILCSGQTLTAENLLDMLKILNRSEHNVHLKLADWLDAGLSTADLNQLYFSQPQDGAAVKGKLVLEGDIGSMGAELNLYAGSNTEYTSIELKYSFHLNNKHCARSYKFLTSERISSIELDGDNRHGDAEMIAALPNNKSIRSINLVLQSYLGRIDCIQGLSHALAKMTSVENLTLQLFPENIENRLWNYDFRPAFKNLKQLQIRVAPNWYHHSGIVEALVSQIKNSAIEILKMDVYQSFSEKLDDEVFCKVKALEVLARREDYAPFINLGLKHEAIKILRLDNIFSEKDKLSAMMKHGWKAKKDSLAIGGERDALSVVDDRRLLDEGLNQVLAELPAVQSSYPVPAAELLVLRPEMTPYAALLSPLNLLVTGRDGSELLISTAWGGA
ncbi:hypothetical protein QS306_01970 [Paraburkholderia bonniea]|uniref:hypothetical protein n=1 Tax=Paraburkholderia bonniea TaxID=2152891 RepID=UPI0025731747|nr:hypothetical protein [Paraburkholderia bonniea]WJF90473.1 hypothetical protein QS306_01970 [Paraburkholderia bonniea]WJF93788.1 hypothetical protein QS308_01970 [Paraburkholderia bonniea]